VQVPSIPGWPGAVPRAISARLSSLAGLAAFVRERLAEVPAWIRREDGRLSPADGRDTAEAVGQVATVVVAAAATFAPTSYARARLLRQLHASGLLTERETEQAEQLFGVAQ
jgi:hypothetical protein